MFAVESQVILIYRHTNNSICLYKYNYTINNKRMQLKISNHYVFHETQEFNATNRVRILLLSKDLQRKIYQSKGNFYRCV